MEALLKSLQTLYPHISNDRIQGGDTTCITSVEGTVEHIDIHNKNQCKICSPLYKNPIICTFQKEKLDSYKNALDRKSKVSITGEATYRYSEAVPYQIVAHTLVVHNEPMTLAQIKSIRGSIPNMTHGKSIQDHLGEIRDEWDSS